uniref:F-box associated domain-containing protein n=1 Tax=Lactuca sativa TaxID=4236 RepID=A0A9R1XMZ5_LACSA|nr:hypothetical protein LSAT_V11C300145220 [Lactuca sativa]
MKSSVSVAINCGSGIGELFRVRSEYNLCGQLQFDFKTKILETSASSSFWILPRLPVKALPNVTIRSCLQRVLGMNVTISLMASTCETLSQCLFETKTEKFTEIVMPSFGNQMTSSLDFMVLKGCIHFCVAILIDDTSYMENQRCYEMIELWRMNGDGDWTKVLTYGPMSFFLWSQSLLHVMRNGNWLIQNEVDVYVLDMKKHTKEMVFTCNPIYAQRMSKEAYDRMGSKNITPRGKYIETTVSPNKYSLYARKWKFKINSLEWCTVGSWAEYEAYERVMIEKHGNDVTQNPEETVELRVQSQGGRSSDLKFATTGTPLGGVPCPPLSTKSHKNRSGILEEYTYKVWELESEQKEREDMQDQLAKEIEMEPKERKDMQAQI